MVTCGVPGCKKTNSKGGNKPTTDRPNEEMIFSQLPKNEVLQKLWLARCGINSIPYNSRNLYVCSDHFKPEEFYRRPYSKAEQVKICLKRGSIPSLNLPIVIRDCPNSNYTSEDFINDQDQPSESNSSHELDGPKNTDTTNKESAEKNTKKYKQWMENCKTSEETISRLKNPLICPLHFNAEDEKDTPSEVPTQNLTPEEIRNLKQEIATVNQLVAEWMILTQRNIPNVVINGNSLKEKAKEIANVLKIPNFDTDLGWLHGFELYLNLNGISHWRKRKENSNEPVNKLIVVQSIPRDCDVKLVEITNDSENAPNLEQSIQTYGEALEKVNLLEEYFKRTRNSCAVELVMHMQQILINNMD